jgi:hypothetical protein
MKTLAKIILASSLMTLAACSGKGSGESRIHGIQTDEGDDPIPTVIDDEGLTPELIPSEEGPGVSEGDEGPKGSVIACTDISGAYCAETSDMSLKSECDPDDGETLLDKCPAGGKKCDINVKGITFYVYNGLVECSTLEMFANADWD